MAGSGSWRLEAGVASDVIVAGLHGRLVQCCFAKGGLSPAELRRVGCAHSELQWRYLGLSGLLFLPDAVVAHKMKVFSLGVGLFDAVAFGMLPDVALLAGYAMCAVVEVLPVHAADSAVKDPLVFFLGQFVEFLLPTLHFELEVAFRHAGIGGFELLAVLLELLELLFVQDALHFPLLEALLPGEHARLAGLLANMLVRKLVEHRIGWGSRLTSSICLCFSCSFLAIFKSARLLSSAASSSSRCFCTVTLPAMRLDLFAVASFCRFSSSRALLCAFRRSFSAFSSMTGIICS